MNPKPTRALTAAEKLSAAVAAQATAAKQIAATEEKRKAALLADDDVIAKACDGVLMDLRQAAQRCADKIELLRPVAERERSEADWPSTVPAARELLAKSELRLADLQRKHRFDLSSGDQTEIDQLIRFVPRLHRHLELMKKMRTAHG